MKTQSRQKRCRIWISKVLLFTLLASVLPAGKVHAVESNDLLGDAAYVEGTAEQYVYFPHATVEVNKTVKNPTGTINTLMVSVDKGSMDLTKVSVPDNVNMGTDTKVAVWYFTPAATSFQVQAMLRSIKFKYEEGMKVNVVADSNETNTTASYSITSNRQKDNNHYYMYVPGNVTWLKAYNSAKSMTFMGMKGYLATLEEGKPEAALLKEISDKAGWCGGTVQVYTANNQRIKDEDIEETGSILIGVRPNMPTEEDNQYIPMKKEDIPAGTPAEAAGQMLAAHNRTLYYWACGPAAGVNIPTSLWADNEPDHKTSSALADEQQTCVVADCAQPEVLLYDILKGNVTDPLEKKADGYFVEFGGYIDAASQNLTADRISQEKVVHMIKVSVDVDGGAVNYFGNGQAIYKKDYRIKIIPGEGRFLPDSISVKAGSHVLSAAKGEYSWDYTTGMITVYGANVTGDLQIDVKCLGNNPSLSIAAHDAEVKSQSSVQTRQEFLATIKAKDGFVLPASVDVMHDGAKMTVGNDYSWDAATGIIKIYAKNMTGNVDISVTGVKKGEAYSATVEVEDGKYSGAETAKAGENYAVTITPKTHYKLPSDVTVKIAGKEVEENKAYKWDDETGQLTVFGKAINGDVEIHADCHKKGVYTVTASVSGGTYTGSANVEEGNAYSATIKADEGYVTPEAITVTVGGDEIREGIDYTYNASSGSISINQETVKGNIEIVAGCTLKAAAYTVTCNVKNGTCGDLGSANSGQDYTLTVKANDGYRLPDEITVKVGEKLLTAGTGYTYDKESGKITVKGTAVTGNIAVSVDCVEGTVESTATGSAGSNQSAAPKTGDANNLLLYILIMTLGVGGVVGSLVYKTLKEY